MAGLQEWLRPPIAKKKAGHFRVVNADLAGEVAGRAGQMDVLWPYPEDDLPHRRCSAWHGQPLRRIDNVVGGPDHTCVAIGRLRHEQRVQRCPGESAMRLGPVPASNAAMRLLVVMASFQGVRDQSHRRGPRADRSDPLRGEGQLRRMAAPGTDPCQSGGPRSRRRKSVGAVSGLNC